MLYFFNYEVIMSVVTNNFDRVNSPIDTPPKKQTDEGRSNKSLIVQVATSTIAFMATAALRLEVYGRCLDNRVDLFKNCLDDNVNLFKKCLDGTGFLGAFVLDCNQHLIDCSKYKDDSLLDCNKYASSIAWSIPLWTIGVVTAVNLVAHAFFRSNEPLLNLKKNLSNTVVSLSSHKDLPQPESKENFLKSFYGKVNRKTIDCIKRFGFGVAAEGIILPVTGGAVFLSQKIGLIQEMGDSANLIKELVAKVSVLANIKLDAETIANATCPLQEFVSQIGAPHQAVFKLKAGLVGLVAVGTPIVEEVIFRGLIQDVMLKRVPKYLIKKIAPGKETALDSTIAKITRITLTAALFSASHLSNLEALPDSYVSAQVVGTFVMGIGWGALKEFEPKGGLLSSIGAHITQNLGGISPILLSC